MSLDRTHISIGTSSTIPNVTWENEIVNKLNSITTNALDLTATKGYISGLTLEMLYANSTQITVYPGTCVDDTGSDYIKLEKALTFTTNGSLDIGTLTANTWYYIWLVRTQKSNRVSILLSLSDTTPTLNGGLSVIKRLIGAIFVTNTNGNVRRFTQSGSENTRDFQFPLTTIISGSKPTNNSFVSLNCANYVPNSIYSRLINVSATIFQTASSTGNVSRLKLRNGNASGAATYDVPEKTSSVINNAGDDTISGLLATDSSANIYYGRFNASSGQGDPSITVNCNGFRMIL